MMPMWLLLLGCAPPPEVTVAGGPPSVEIVFPLDSSVAGDVVCATFPVVVATDDFTLSPDGFGADNADGQGHWHLYVDDPELVERVASTAAPYALVTPPSTTAPTRSTPSS